MNGNWRSAWPRLAAAGCLVALAACGGGGGGGGDTGAGPGPVAGADYFPLDVGNRWAYQGSDGPASVSVTGTRVVGGRTVFVVISTDATGGTEELYEKTATGVLLVAAPGADALDTLLDGMPVLRLPLVAGQTEVPLDRAVPGVGDLDGDGRADSITVRVQTTVLGFEAITTPVGSWNNVAHVRSVLTQVVSLTLGNRRLTTTITSDDWYAPNVGPVRNELAVSDDTGTQRETQTLAAYRVGAQRSENVAPTVQSSSVSEGAALRGVNEVRVSFSEPMYAPSVADGGLTLTGPDGRPVAGRFYAGVVDNGATYFFSPEGAVPGGAFTLAVTAAAQDIAGNGVAAPRNWQFTVDNSGPRVLSMTPASGASDVALDGVIRITFDEDLDPATVPGAFRLTDEQTGDAVAVTLTHSGRTVTLTPNAPLQPRRQYTVHVWLSLRDTLGNAPPDNVASSFRTEPGRFGYVNTFNLAGSGVAYDGFGTGTVAFGDVDGDGRGDLLVTPGVVFSGTGIEPNLPPPQPLFWVWRMNTDGTLRTPLRAEPPAGYTCRSPALAVLDFDGDGRLDVAAGSDCGLALYRQGADGVLTLREVLPAPGLLRLRAADMDGDGRADLVGTGWSGDAAWVWTQRAEGGFGAAEAQPVQYYGWTALALGDYSGDGRPDIAIAGANTLADAVAFLRQRAAGGYGPATYASVDPQSGAQGVAVGDLNGDGRADVLVGTFTANPPSLKLFLQQADGSLAAPASLPAAGSASAITLADMNGDGRLDAVVSFGGLVVLYEQQADGSLGPRIDIASLGSSISPNPQALLVADLDGNGLPDIVLNERYVLQRGAPGASAGAAPRAPKSFRSALRPAPAPATSAR